MNKTMPKIIQVSDIVQWNDRNELVLSPKYQRNSVWNEKAKSYLIDTIVRGLPIPPIFLRQMTDVNTKSTKREIIDGQQRIRAILEYVVDEKYAINQSHNKEYGGKKYSNLDENMKEAILGYAILAEVVTEKNESLFYDMFARLNSNNYVLNRQEIRNAQFWGDFKVLVYSLTSKYRNFFLSHDILSDKECTRMEDAKLITSMIILLIVGITDETPSSVDKIYKEFNTSFDNKDSIENQLILIMEVIEKVYGYFNGQLGRLSNKNYFFTFYAVIANQMFGINNANMERNSKFSENYINNNINLLYEICGNFINDCSTGIANSQDDWRSFHLYHKSKTTSKTERIKRISLMNKYYFCG